MHHLTLVLRSAAALAVVLVAACDPPTHPRNFGQTILNNACYFQFNCCAPSERGFFGVSGSPDEASCREELTDTFGSFTAVAAEAVDRGTATYDAEAAERCTADRRAAVASCDSDALAGAAGLSSTAVLFLVDERDAECLALAVRSFTRGTVKGGDDCLSDVDCADFGRCQPDEDADPDFDVGGSCRPLTAEGGSCDDEDFIGCQPGLFCNVDRECAPPPELLDDGDACSGDGQCAGFCDTGDNAGVCAVDGGNCDFDEDCPDACIDNVCSDGFECSEDFDCFGSACAINGVCASREVRIEICDGL